MKPGGARMKGQEGEREVIKLLEPIVKECGQGMLFRNLDQTRSGGHDIIGLDWIAMEIKRQEVLDIDNWWKQTIRQAGEDKIPVLIYRQSRQPWRVIMWARLYNSVHLTRVTITFNDFKLWFRDQLISRQVAPSAFQHDVCNVL